MDSNEIKKERACLLVKRLMNIMGTDKLTCFKPFECYVSYYGEIDDEMIKSILINDKNEIVITYDRLNADGTAFDFGDDLLVDFSANEAIMIVEEIISNLNDEANTKLLHFFKEALVYNLHMSI